MFDFSIFRTNFAIEMPGGQKEVLISLTINELKERLRSRDLPTTGNKNELIARLLNADPCIEISEERDNGEAAYVASPMCEDRRGGRGAEALGGADDVPNEIELLRLERELLRREIETMRRERDLQTSPSENAPMVQSTLSIKTIADLLVEFTGEKDDFKNWKQQLELLRETYRLDDNAVRILISLRLRGKASKWFHSRPDHLRMSATELLSAMGDMFDHRPNKLSLRKEFESRLWRKGESFSDYFFDKITLANRITIDPEELVDFVIDGIPDVRLRDQARMNRYEDPKDILEAFKKVTLYESRNDRDRRDVGRYTKPMKKGDTIRPGEARCFNCHESGHLSKDCKKPSRVWGSCYNCGSLEHHARNCTRTRPAAGTRAQEASRPTEASGSSGTSTHLIQPACPENPFMVPVSFVVPIDDCKDKHFVISAMIDSGSPVSLIRVGLLPDGSYDVESLQDHTYLGINQSPLQILGVFERIVDVNSVLMNIKFLVVPNETMSHAAILGRDYMLSPLIKVTLGHEYKIEKRNNTVEKETDDFVSDIMQIDIVNAVENAIENLNINPETDLETAETLMRMFYDEKDATDDLEFSTGNVELEIKLTDDRPIAFRPRRLAFCEKEKLREILNDLCVKNVIRPSSSPYASPIVLVRKKNGEIRLCIDYRELNKITVKENFPTPNIDDCIDQLRKKKYYTKLDLKSGFHHVKVAESSIKFTSFVTPLGQFEYLRMPFGLTNAPRVFQRFVDSIFRDLIDKNQIITYLDDILIATEAIDEHLSIVEEVFRLAKKNGLCFRLDKCSFLYREVTYLGYLIDASGVRPSQEGIQSVLEYPVPHNVKEVQRFV